MKVLIYGTGKMAEFITYALNHDSPHQVVAYCVDDAYIPPLGAKLLGLPIVSFNQAIIDYPKENYLVHVAIGRNSARETAYLKAKEAGYTFVNYISSKAIVWPDLVVGKNVFIDQGCNIHPFVTVGNNCMLIGSRIGHHSTIKNNVLLSGNILAGNVTIGHNSFLGMNSLVKENVIIGSNNIVGAGVFVMNNTEDNALITNPSLRNKVRDSTGVIMFRSPTSKETVPLNYENSRLLG